MIKSKALSLTLSAAMIASLAGLVGCGNNTDGNTTRTHNVGMNNNGRTDGNMLRNNSYGRTDGNMLGRYNTNNYNNSGAQHDLTNLKYSKTLSEKISKVKGVRDAHVFVTRDNAYVSLSLDGQSKNHVTNPNTTANGNFRSMGTDGTTLGMDGAAGRHDGIFGGSRTGGTGILRGMSDPRGTLDNNTGLGSTAGTGQYGVRGGYSNGIFGGRHNTMGHTGGTGLMGTNNVRTLNNGSDGRMGINGTMNNYSGTGNGSNENSVPRHIRDEVNHKIHKTLPNVKQVYVSSDTGFYEHARGYRGNHANGTGVRGNNTTGNSSRGGNVVGNSVRTLGHDMGAWINRIFPLGHHGTYNNGVNTYGTGTGHPDGMMNNNGYKDGIFNMNRNKR